MRRRSGTVSGLLRGDLTVMADRRGDGDATPVDTANGAIGVKRSWRIREGLRRECETRITGRQTGVSAYLVRNQRLSEQSGR